MKIKEIPISIYYSLYFRYFFKEEIPKNNIPIVISLTSIPSRLETLDIVIKSLLNQSIKATSIILWLNISLKNKIPKKLLKLQGKIFVIKYCDGNNSFRKLLPTLIENPKSTIVTCDDDVIYPPNWLENLYSTHLKLPNIVISQVGRLINRDKKGSLEDYKNWTYINREYSSKNLLPIGYGGVLYPVGTFNKQVFDDSIYLKLCPNADDLWFKAMAYLNNKSAYCASEKAKPIPILFSQKEALGKKNISENGNYYQWQALCNHFPELKKIG